MYLDCTIITKSISKIKLLGQYHFSSSMCITVSTMTVSIFILTYNFTHFCVWFIWSTTTTKPPIHTAHKLHSGHQMMNEFLLLKIFSLYYFKKRFPLLSNIPYPDIYVLLNFSRKRETLGSFKMGGKKSNCYNLIKELV